MLKIIQILLFFFCSYSVIGQSTTTKELIEYLKGEKFSIDSIRSILNVSDYDYAHHGISMKLNNGISINTYIEREVDFGSCQFLLEYHDTENFSDYEIAIQYTNEYPIIILVYKRGLTGDQAILNILSEDIDSLLKKYNSKYKSNYKAKEIETDFLKPYEFGYACSFGGSPTDKFSEMMRLVNFKRRKKLKRWLVSPNINLRLFGAVGLEWLSYSGIKLSVKENEIIDELKQKNYLINYCAGCSVFELRSFEELRNDENLKKFYSHYKSRGWFQ